MDTNQDIEDTKNDIEYHKTQIAWHEKNDNTRTRGSRKT